MWFVCSLRSAAARVMSSGCLVVAVIVLLATYAPRLNAQEPLCPTCGPMLEVYGSPSNVYQTPGVTNQTATFVVANHYEVSLTVTLSCSVQAPVASCGSVTPSSVFVTAESEEQVTVQYNVAGTTGTGNVFLTGYHDDEELPNPGAQGFVQVNVEGPVAPGIVLRNRPDQLERGLCLTAGAGEAAWQCGDLLVAHGMPGYRTLGRDRALTLVYNSATAAPRPTVAVNVTQPWGAQTPDSVYAELRVGLPGGAQTVRASATYQGWAPGPVTKQIVLSFDAQAEGLPTGAYDYTLLVRNTYGSGPKDTTQTGQLIVVNRVASRFGRGWALAGTEWIQGFGSGGWPDIKLVWVGGDGSARIYLPVGGGIPKWVAPAGAYRDTISYESPVYKRRLRHGVEVHFDGFGRHVTTVNRVGHETGFAWGTGDSLVSIAVPPSGTGGSYTVQYDGTGKVDRLVDPGSRVLDLTLSSGHLTSLLDPDNVSVAFGYDGAGRMTSRTNRKGHATRYEYGNGLRVTKSHVPYGATGADTARTTYDAWDERGLFIGTGGSALVAIDSFQIRTKIDGPRTDVSDTAAFYVDRWGAPVRTVNAIGAVTQIVRSDAAKPALVTKVIAPNGRVDSLTWNARGNLVQSRTITSDQAVQVTTWEYTSANTADAPSRVIDPLNRSSYFYYNGQGLTDSTLDPRQLGVRYSYTADWLVKAVRLHNVPVWRNSDSSSQTLALDDSLFYDAKGNLTGWRHANGTRTSYELDTFGRTIKTYDPLGMPTRYLYDAINRSTAVWKRKVAESHPGGVNPLAGCDAAYFVCIDSAVSIDPPEVSPSDSGHFKTRYVYGSATLDSVLDPRNVVRTYLADARGEQRGERDEFGQLQTAERNAAGLITSITSRDGFVTTFQYDALGRRTTMTMPQRGSQHPGDAQVVPADTVVTQYDAMGNPTLTQNRDAVIVRGFYQNGALKYRKTTVSGIVDSLHFTYDAAGALSRIRYNAKDSVRYTYGSSGDLDSVIVALKEGASYNTRVFRFQWDKLGRRSQVTYPVNSMVVTLAYDQLGVLRRLNSTNSATSGSASNRFDFELRNRGVSPTGQILSQTIRCRKWNVGDLFRLPCGSEVANQLTASRYNHLGMLALQTMVGFASRTDSMIYDPSGNMIRRHRWDTGAGVYERQFFALSTAGAFGVSNRLVADSSTTNDPTQLLSHSYTLSGDRRYERPSDSTPTYAHRFKWYYYDAQGRMSGSKYVTWDGFGWFTHVGPTDCLYDGEGNMTKPCENGAPRLLYNGVNVARSSNGWRFIHGPGLDDPLIAIMRNGSDVVQGEPMYFVTDGTGRQVAVGHANGNIGTDFQPGGTVGKQDWNYSGGISKAQSFSPDRFAGSTPATAGLSFFRNRAYDARTGRWTQEDPVGVAGGVNLYQFNGNNPIMYTDPFGLCPKKAKDGSVCIDLFIQAKQIGPFRGDNRGFNPDAPASASRVQIVVGPGGSGTTTTASPSCTVAVGCAAPRASGSVSTTAGEEGSFTVKFDGFKNSSIPFGASPDIDGQVTFTSDGKGGYLTSGNITAFPSNAVYQRVKGEWVELHRHTETTPADLFDNAGRDKF